MGVRGAMLSAINQQRGTETLGSVEILKR
jgi:hypothetical protein